MRPATRNTDRSGARTSTFMGLAALIAGLLGGLAGCSDLQDHPTATVTVLADPVETDCRACHGLPPGPDTGHPQNRDCRLCHGAVVDSALTIINPTLHRDGVVEVFSHPAGWADPASGESFHGASIRKAGWDMSSCRGCHGADYRGGLVGSSCLTCHPGTPEGCTVCHGSAANSAPPQDTHGNRETRFAGVGAHQSHVVEGTVGRALACSECHRVPATFGDPAHIDGDGRAEVTFGSLARTGGAAPAYDAATATCTGSYCHSGGGFGHGGPVVWTAVGTGAGACGTCHGIPPAPTTGHPAVLSGIPCTLCHATVVDARLAIVSRDLHLNGRKDVTCGTCHGIPPAPASGHPQVAKCNLCHVSVIDANYHFIDESLHRNGRIDF